MAKRKKTRTHEVKDIQNVPKSFVLKSGTNFPSSSMLLLKDIRKMMLPHTAERLKQKRKNKLKDFIHVAGQLNVTHSLILSKTNTGTNLRIGRFPRGPTMTFRVDSYALMRDVLTSNPKSKPPALTAFNTAPLIVLNNFSKQEKHITLLSVMFQNMFPSIDVQKLKIEDVKRVVLFNYVDDVSGGGVPRPIVQVRQYLVHIKKTMEASKKIQHILKTRLSNHDISHFEDVAEYLLQTGYASETTDGEENVVLEEEEKKEKRGIRLFEIGPRLELHLLKIQEEFCGGSVLYHSLCEKTKGEQKALELRKNEEKRVKEQRRKVQEENVKRKKEIAETNKPKNKKAAVPEDVEDSGNMSVISEDLQDAYKESDQEDGIDVKFDSGDEFDAENIQEQESEISEIESEDE